MVRPEPGALLLVSAANSRNCFADYRPRSLFDTERDLGLHWRTPSVVVAVRLAELLGCTGLTFVACDSYTTGDVRTCLDGLASVGLDDEQGTSYRHLKGLVDGLLAVSRIRDVRWVTP
jgi:hypothetical protein